VIVPVVFGTTTANMCITSPPYAAQRDYDPSSGFRPVPPEEYSAWYRDVAAHIAAALADDGSYFLLCGSPHNRKYAETMIMRSRRRSGGGAAKTSEWHFA
jgi:hypothetical protein